MGHDIHFLERLERVSIPEADLALALYRDPRLVGFVLQRMRLPEGAERVALALTADPQGPHVIVTRAGDFVTCLAAGMTPHPHPVVSYTQIQLEAERTAPLRAALEEPGSDEDRGLAPLSKLIRRADRATREDFLAVAKWAPLLGDVFRDWLLTFVRDSLRASMSLFAVRRLTDPETREAFALFWRSFVAQAHLTLLVGVEQRQAAISLRIPAAGGAKDVSASELAVHASSQVAFLRGAWLVARAGPEVLPLYAARHREPQYWADVLDTTAGMAAMAVRHPKLRPEVLKELRVPFEPEREDPDDDKRTYGAVRRAGLALVEAPALYAERALDAGARWWVRSAAHFPPGAPHRYERVEDVPRDIATATALSLDSDPFEGMYVVRAGMTLLALAARAYPEDFYLPAACSTHLPPTDRHIRGRDVASRWWAREGIQRPVRKEAAPGRNDPCPCGSGKKHKRCCAA